MTAPERIWLQDNGDFDAASEVTWCQHRIEDNDTEYVRADLAAVPAQVKVLAMRDAGYDTPTDPRDAVIARLVDALEFYAPRQIDGITFTGNDDAGVRARAALASGQGGAAWVTNRSSFPRRWCARCWTGARRRRAECCRNRTHGFRTTTRSIWTCFALIQSVLRLGIGTVFMVGLASYPLSYAGGDRLYVRGVRNGYDIDDEYGRPTGDKKVWYRAATAI
jgi:hypothetical protein